jgi:hypothetical protein
MRDVRDRAILFGSVLLVLVGVAFAEDVTYDQMQQGIQESISIRMLHRKQKFLKDHPELSAEDQKSILAGQVSIGMTSDEVKASWGAPEHINKDIGSWGVHEQWIYGDQYLYFENGKLTSLQTH